MKIPRTLHTGTLVVLMISLSLTLHFCSTPKKEVTPQDYKMPEHQLDTKVSYADHIVPLMVNSCTPCHFPEKGKKKLLNTYEATAETIDEIIYRVTLPSDSTEFMPYKSKKLPLSANEIQLLIKWRDQGMSR